MELPIHMSPTLRRGTLPSLVALALAGCAAFPSGIAPDEPRPHDARRYTVDEAALRATLTPTDAAALRGHGAFGPIPTVSTDRWVGVLNGAAYQVEVPRDWNGQLVMYDTSYAHRWLERRCRWSQKEMCKHHAADPHDDGQHVQGFQEGVEHRGVRWMGDSPQDAAAGR